MPTPPTAPARNDRAGLKTVVTFVDPEIAKLLKVAAADSNTTVQRITEQAIVTALRKFFAREEKRLIALDAAIKRTEQRLQSNERSVVG